MDIEDCLDITVKLMDLDFEHIRKSGGSKTWNVNGLSFSPKEWEHAVNNYLSKVYFSSQNDSNGTLQASLIVSYATLDPIRDAIAASWPESLDDSRLRTLVRWKPRIETISQLAEKLITELAQYYNLSIVPK